MAVPPKMPRPKLFRVYPTVGWATKSVVKRVR